MHKNWTCRELEPGSPDSSGKAHQLKMFYVPDDFFPSISFLRTGVWTWPVKLTRTASFTHDVMFRLKRIISLFSLALNLHPPLQTCSETTHCCGSLIIYFLNLNLGKVHIKNSCEILFPVYNLRSETVPSHRWWSVYTRSKDYGNTPVQQVAVTQKTEQQKWAGTSDACRRGHARLKANTQTINWGLPKVILKSVKM